MLYSPFGKEIKINRAIKSKDNISVLFLYIYDYSLLLQTFACGRSILSCRVFFTLGSTIRYVKVEPIYFSSPQKKYGTSYIFVRGLESVNYAIRDRPK